ncbi:AP-2 complex subunit alpha [Intoshia linei]|uniref:AP-2 complex subunit alpha n=1 Tax=Intoshia linei TaxID=1819745 RepID=A0A177B102_9BILA|nr:AP-2 complex subunit alpha [Intoshia linei]
MNVLRGDTMRGLHVFISNIRNCKSTEEEQNRINKELSHVRNKFRGDKVLDGYNKKKYVCKLVYIYLLGYDIDFGHMEAINLLSSIKYSEKQIGYLFLTILWCDVDEYTALLLQAIKADFNSKNPTFVALAMQCVANIGSREMAINLGEGIPIILISPDTNEKVKQTAALCLLTLIRKHPSEMKMNPETCTKIYHFLNTLDFGVLTAAISLIIQMVKMDYPNIDIIRPLAINRLSKLIIGYNNGMLDYTYYFVTAPWVSVKLLELLQHFSPSEDLDSVGRITDVLKSILKKANESEKSTKVQHSNARYSIIFEAINLILHMDCLPNLVSISAQILTRHLRSKDPNMRFLSMESLALLSTSQYSRETVKSHRTEIIDALNTETDVSIRKRCIDLLYAMCDQDNVVDIVDCMLNHLRKSDYALKSGIVLKLSILAEKYKVNYTWYIDIMMDLLSVAGDFVSDEVCNRFIQVIVNNDEIQQYTAKCVFDHLDTNLSHQTMVKVGAYLLGEFGSKISQDPSYSPEKQLSLLNSKFYYCQSDARQLMLTTYAKMATSFSSLKTQIIHIFNQDLQSRSGDIESQQRVLEYTYLINSGNSNLINTVFDEMPPYAEKKFSTEMSKEINTMASSSSNVSFKAENKGDDLLNFSSSSDAISKKNEFTKSRTNSKEITTIVEAKASPIRCDPSSYSSQGSSSKIHTESNFTDILKFDDEDHNDTLSKDKSISIDPKYRILLYNQSAVVYEDENVQIGMKSQFNGRDGRFLIALGNKSNNTIDNVFIENENSYLFNSSVKIDKINLPSTISAKSQVSSQQKIHLDDLFYNIYPVTLKMSGVTNFCHTIFLPVFMSSFFTKFSCSIDEYNQRWHEMDGYEYSINVWCSIEDINQLKIMMNSFGFQVMSDNSVDMHCCAKIPVNPEIHVFMNLYVNEACTIITKSINERLSIHIARLFELALMDYALHQN